MSGIVGKDNLVIFDKDSYILPADCPEVVEIRRLINQAMNKIKLYEKKGVYLMPLWINTEVEDAGFTR